MMMDEIRLKNFRCFREEQTARLAPLTLLVGENSTGKTSFLALIRALWDLARRNRVPNFKEEPYDLGSFDEIAHHRGARGSRAETFEAGFVVTHEDRPKNWRTTRDVRYRLNVVFGKKGTVPILMKRRFSNEEEDVWIESSRSQNPYNDVSWEFSVATPKGEWTIGEGQLWLDDDHVLSSDFFRNSYLGGIGGTSWRELADYRFVVRRGSGQPDDSDWELIKRIYDAEQRFRGCKRLYASAPVRSTPHRTYDPSRPTRDSEGDYVPMDLADLSFRDVTRWKALKDALEKFGKEAGLFDEISVMPLGKTASGPFQLQIRKFGRKAKGPQRNLIDVGYGVSQVLPVITELLRDDAPPMFLLQQPEVHLHPSAQAALGSLLCQVATPWRQLVVETHSDHLLDRVRMDVRDGVTKLKPEDVSILYFERDDLDVRIHSLRLDEEGNVLDAPPSYRKFFLEETRKSLGL